MIATAAQLYNHAYPDRKMLFGRHSSLKQCFGIHAASPGLCKMLIVNFYMITWTHTHSLVTWTSLNTLHTRHIIRVKTKILPLSPLASQSHLLIQVEVGRMLQNSWRNSCRWSSSYNLGVGIEFSCFFDSCLLDIRWRSMRSFLPPPLHPPTWTIDLWVWPWQCLCESCQHYLVVETEDRMYRVHWTVNWSTLSAAQFTLLILGSLRRGALK